MNQNEEKGRIPPIYLGDLMHCIHFNNEYLYFGKQFLYISLDVSTLYSNYFAFKFVVVI